MAVLEILGDDATVRTETTLVVGPSGIEKTIERHEGPIPKVTDLYDTAKAGSEWDDINYKKGGGKGVLVLTKSGAFASREPPTGGDQSTDTTIGVRWEMVAEQLWQPLRANPEFRQEAAQLGLNKVRTEFERGNVNYVVVNATLLAYQRLLNRGVEQYLRHVPVLQATITVSSRSIIAASWVGVDRAWKQDGQDGSPEPPTALIGTLGNIKNYQSDKKQWLKLGAQLRQVSDYEYEIVQQWWWARRWSFLLYEGDEETDNP
jgi:hypothetical protein